MGSFQTISFDLIPGRPVSVLLKVRAPITRNSLLQDLKIRSLAECYYRHTLISALLGRRLNHTLIPWILATNPWAASVDLNPQLLKLRIFAS